MVQSPVVGATLVLSSTPPGALHRRGDPTSAPVGVVERSTSPTTGSASPPQSPPATSSEPSATSSQETEAGGALRYDSPQATHERYVAVRAAAYATQPAGSIKIDQQYRRAMSLPLKYDRTSYE